MTPQSSFMILAAVTPDREAELRSLLDSMNDAPGRTNPDNELLPFRQFDTLHFMRLLIVDDKTVDDVRLYGMVPRTYPLYLALAGDIDGDVDGFLAEMAARVPAGLRTIFSCCDGFAPGADLVRWMQAHNVPNAASYVNWRGRTVRQVHEEAALHDALERHIENEFARLDRRPAQEIHATLRRLILADVAAGRLTLSPERPTPLGWRLRNFLHLVGVPSLALLALPFVLPIAVVVLVRLRRLEKTDPELCPRTPTEHNAALAVLEDYGVSNQYTAMGSLKPGVVRLLTGIVVLVAIDYGSRHLYTRGGLARVRSIHFARWVFLDNRQRIVFFSNYDGSHESYMDDFVNKVGFGLNVVFSNGVGYPRTNWLILDGCSDERKFKEFNRRHQVPTQVWYKAYPGLTALDLDRNTQIRQGLGSASMSDDDAREWVALL
jgi:hypothetical protein